MPTYDPLFKQYPDSLTDGVEAPEFDDYRFVSPLDVVEFARHDRCIGQST